jgi:hypothetical protein
MIFGVTKSIALFAAVLATAIGFAQWSGRAEATKLPCPCPGQGNGGNHGQKPKSLVGSYEGTTEEGGAVSFRVTRGAKVVGFTLTAATLYCTRGYPEERVTYFPDYTKSVTVRHPGPIPMRKVSKKHPQGKEFLLDEPRPENQARQSALFKGKTVELLKPSPTGSIVLPNRGFVGEIEYETADGPTPFPSSANPLPEWDPNREWCVTKPIDWSAKKPGDPGVLPRG